MKPLLLLALCLFSMLVNAQNDYQDSLIKELLSGKLKSNNQALAFNNAGLKNTKPLSRDANGKLLPGTHRLPQDGMPCIVPDTKDIVALPNAFKGKVSIPFAGTHPRMPNSIINDLQFRNKKIISVPILGDKNKKPE